MNTRPLHCGHLVDHNAAEYLNSHGSLHTITYMYAHDTYVTNLT